MAGDQKPSKVTITVHEPIQSVSSSPEFNQRLALEMVMDCKNCGRAMIRGSQCENCGAWCR